MGWTEYETYWISDDEQGSQAWLNTRKCRLTQSNTGAALGHSSFSTPYEVAQVAAGVLVKEFSQKTIDIMHHGTITEPLAREWYEKRYKCQVIERGLAIPKWNKYLGASVDGEVVGIWNESTQSYDECCDGIIEIKCPQRMYYPLKEHNKLLAQGIVFDKYCHGHIWDSHYDQMQGNMLILNKKWCDYIVYCTPEQSIYYERVHFNKKYCDDVLYPGMTDFIENKLKPLLTEEPYVPEQFDIINF